MRQIAIMYAEIVEYGTKHIPQLHIQRLLRVSNIQMKTKLYLLRLAPDPNVIYL